MKAYVLTMPNRTDRLSNFASQYPSSLPTCQTWVGKTASEVTAPDWWRGGEGALSRFRNLQEVLQACVSDNDNYLLFEDDCIFADDFGARYDEFLAEVPTDWDLLNFGCYQVDTLLYPPVQVAPHVLRPKFGMKLHALQITPAGAAKILAKLAESPWGCKHISSQQIARLYLDPTFVVYCPIANFVGQAAGWSDIANRDEPERWFNDFEYINLDGERAKTPTLIALEAARAVEE